MTAFLSRILVGAAGFAALLGLGSSGALAQETPAKQIFGAVQRPSDTATQSIGFYAKGCLSGGIGLPLEGPNWQIVNPGRNRRWGHPVMIDFLERFSKKAAADGWPGLLVGDISQPRGGPMASGHASHQIGLDADIWFTPMPKRRLTPAEREPFQGPSMLRKGTFTVDDSRWSPVHVKVLREAAEDPKVQRIFVNPGIKRKLCETVTGDRSWLSKVRPFYGHDQHFHIRLFCQPGSPNCDGQAETASGDGCGKDLDYWFNVALRPPPPPKPGAKPPKPKPPMTLAALPSACRSVLAAPAAGSAPEAPVAPVAIRAPAGVPAAAAIAPEPAASGGPRPKAGIPMPGARPLE
ncbi:penicillin-insensitive murein endopeptidase [Aureimonas endophytica]|uniref:Penicillin-insensitive murein endopeptidase n=1 Tax=Aureimonas endophytica TaxID=2027858 RepID=A0A916ZR70_9HYPH|nr:penicillin-insensitive murein endopeptidase [Aureimonas endophytica]GGE08774.1 penicillin-insensitive murein endopeptidase [Aureimonas endophytica]